MSPSYINSREVCGQHRLIELIYRLGLLLDNVDKKQKDIPEWVPAAKLDIVHPRGQYLVQSCITPAKVFAELMTVSFISRFSWAVVIKVVLIIRYMEFLVSSYEDPRGSASECI